VPLSQSALAETNAVATVVESLALSRPAVGFFLRADERRSLTFPAAADLSHPSSAATKASLRLVSSESIALASGTWISVQVSRLVDSRSSASAKMVPRSWFPNRSFI
jgi:hypothetical protein